MTTTDPFEALASAPPPFSADDAAGVASGHYGLAVSARELVSERDQNFLLVSAEGDRSILKIANVAEDPAVTEFQIEALLHIEARGYDSLPVPRIVRTSKGRSHIELPSDQGMHVCRLVSYLPGTLLEDRHPNVSLAASLGQLLALLDSSLESFTHRGQDQALLWDMKRAPELRRLLPHVDDDGGRSLIEATLDEFEAVALPAFDEVPWQVIHNDANPANVLTTDEPPLRAAGLIDFGDMIFAPRIIELGVAGSYMRNTGGNPLALVAELVGGYHAELPLTRRETDILYTLVKTRLATTALILGWRASLKGPGDEYLAAASESEASALPFLARLAEIPARNAASVFSQVCASATASGAPAGPG